MPYPANHRAEKKRAIIDSARKLFNRSGSNWKSCWEGVKVDLSSTDVGSQVVRAYLSRQHFEDIENSRPMVACLQMLRVAVQPPKAPSKQYLGPWSAFWSTA